MKRKPTISDVARLAGVSKRTVSRVLNQQPNVSPKAREQVQKAISILNYAPNPLAQGLARGETKILGVFVYESNFPSDRENFFYPFLEGIEASAQTQGYDLLLFTQSHAGQERSILTTGRGKLNIADGVILMGTRTKQQDLIELNRMEIPFVHIGRRDAAGYPVPHVTGDYAQVYYEVANHLIELGHRRLAVVVPSETSEPDTDKLAGVLKAESEHTQKKITVKILTWNSGILSEVKKITEVILNNSPSAVITTAPEHGPMLYAELTNRGIRIPEDLSLISFDSAQTGIDSKTLSHIFMPKQKIASAATTLLIELIKNRQVPLPDRHILIPCQFIRGATISPSCR